jgi:uncharacterized protein YndB with AHSA1/START domain
MNASTVTLELKKVVNVPRAKVFAAWTQPAVVKTWFAPGAMIVPRAEIDLRVGGKYTIEMKGDDGTHTVGGSYKEIVPNEKLVFTWAWQDGGMGGAGDETLVTVLFADKGQDTEVHLIHERFSDAEKRDKHNQGWLGCLENLATRLR